MACELKTIPGANRGPFLTRQLQVTCLTCCESSEWGDGLDAKAWKSRHLKLVAAAADVARRRSEASVAARGEVE